MLQLPVSSCHPPLLSPSLSLSLSFSFLPRCELGAEATTLTRARMHGGNANTHRAVLKHLINTASVGEGVCPGSCADETGNSSDEPLSFDGRLRRCQSSGLLKSTFKGKPGIRPHTHRHTHESAPTSHPVLLANARHELLKRYSFRAAGKESLVHTSGHKSARDGGS